MLLLQFSTSHYCRKARLALGYKRISYKIENLTPGLHILKVKPLTGLTTLPVLLPQIEGQQQAIEQASAPKAMELTLAKGDRRFYPNFQISRNLSQEPALFLPNHEQQTEAWMLEDWLDESIGTAARFVYYQFRAGEGKQIDPSLFSQMVIGVVRQQYGINNATVKLAASRLDTALEELSIRWRKSDYLVGSSLSVADIAAAALLSPLALIPQYRQAHPWLFERIVQVHQLCGEPLPPGL